MVLSNFYRLIVSFVICYGIGFAGALYAVPMLSLWFSKLSRPDFTPPNETMISLGMFVYLLLSLALYFLLSADTVKREDTKTAVYFFIFGLGLNFLWIYMLFGLRSPFLALITMVMLIAILLSTIYQAVHVSLPAAILLVPYFIACIGAIVINYYVYAMNPQLPLFMM
ncbi:MAG TPA: tryptophan-rich sensory protein [Methanoregulaceae archaeon]|nr:tryptophan-rich sensory protein [Methanoregulaceae archaeon]HPD75434.1 tryptophan-rich sensory protein [Methanoregulaceae archaeon]HRY75036.1 tryptophan-rich sensory protein [Methanoregulaceae archaeon]